ncbi:hypothetical protein [Allokutzneria sp. NRRL B-24872]|uniref:hypothetical protein n=1 Tax=Allokutzneria sp. NRRL B-24872 TaxID=1137961 RepID=UPI000A3B31D1|nr:hypothetical protein [Allokutzneria sp. NRRL B-24872]
MLRALDFPIPFALTVNPHVDTVAEDHPGWARSIGLLPPADSWYESYDEADVPAFAARAVPAAAPERLDLAMRVLGWALVWRDQLPRLAAADPRLAVDHVKDLVEACHTERAMRGTSHGVCVWAGLWSELREGMTRDWAVRATRSFTASAVSYLHGGRLDFELVPELLESLLECEVPVTAHDSPQLRNLRLITSRATAWSAYGADDRESVDRAREDMRAFERVREDLPEMMAGLGLDKPEIDAVDRYVTGLGSWTRGHHDWQQALAHPQLPEATNLVTPGCTCPWAS